MHHLPDEPGTATHGDIVNQPRPGDLHFKVPLLLGRACPANRPVDDTVDGRSIMHMIPVHRQYARLRIQSFHSDRRSDT